MRMMVVSLHSCGNLVHHGLRSLIINPFVKTVAMVGCCYNLMTERLGPPTFKLPNLRSLNRRVEQAALAEDPHGFPMSNRFMTCSYRQAEGLRLNITARMMACQAPVNWTTQDCESFFKRHFYRAVLQRLLLEHGIVGKPPGTAGVAEIGLERDEGCGPALTIGSLRKSCYESFVSYVRGAIAKLASSPESAARIQDKLLHLTDESINAYEVRYYSRKKDISILWSLMAFSATIVEAIIVVDRWLYLHEQNEISKCWVQTVFDYGQSPRNLVVVGVKR